MEDRDITRLQLRGVFRDINYYAIKKEDPAEISNKIEIWLAKWYLKNKYFLYFSRSEIIFMDYLISNQSFRNIIHILRKIWFAMT